MPLLPPEPALYPDDLLSRTAPGRPGADGAWWVLHTKPRAEKQLARRLLGRGVGFFLPCYRRTWLSRGRTQQSHLPLFPGYVFLHGPEQDRLTALQSNLVAHCLPVTDQPRLHADLARVHHLIRSDAPLTPEERLPPGTPVEIVSGPLAGLTGKVLRQGKQLKLCVEVQLLQRGVSVEVEAWMIRPR